jgi:2-polyprenyl-3-methyl-5-hydroxy-6-metoxy-1,4-benzoquinol methylase
VTLSHVIEHVHDPVETLRHCCRVLEPGGYLWIETPNVDSAGYATFGRFWRGLEAPRHLVIFNADSLARLLRQVGFDRVEVLPPRDVIKHMFTRSAMMQQGRIADVDFRPLSAPDGARVEAEMIRARAAVRQDARAAEFITITARRPV